MEREGKYRFSPWVDHGCARTDNSKDMEQEGPDEFDTPQKPELFTGSTGSDCFDNFSFDRRMSYQTLSGSG